MTLALLVAGSSLRGILGTTLVQVVAFALLPALVDWSRGNGFWRGVNLLLAAAIGLVVLQLLPVGFLLAGSSAGEIDVPAPLAWTSAWERTAECLLFIGPPALLFVVLSRFSENDFNRLLPFLYLGIIINIVFGFVQFAARSEAALSPGFLSYAASAGFFANQNHFATLMFVAIPLVIYQFEAVRKPLLSLLSVAVIVLASFATRSVAGVFLSLGCALFSYAVIARMRTSWRLALIATALVGMVILSFNPGNVLEVRADDPLDRSGIWKNTLQGIAAEMPLGSGFGSFDLVYPRFEALSDIRYQFVNHAHNEYLELLLEGGIAAGGLLLAYLALLVVAMWRMPSSQLRWAAFCGIVFLLIHSAVDYPLRNMSLVLVLSMLSAIVFSNHVGVAKRRYTF